MVKARLFRIFVASPGDVLEERQGLDAVVAELNRVLVPKRQVVLELIRWETHVRPGFGIDPQDVVNRQVADEYDIFIGIIWARFGTPTARAGSGTEEEFERAHARWKASQESIELMLYFKDAPMVTSQIDPLQLAKVNDFKARIGTELGGLCQTFTATEEFLTNVRSHLLGIVFDGIKREGDKAGPLPGRTLPNLDEVCFAEGDSADLEWAAVRGGYAFKAVCEVLARMDVAERRYSAHVRRLSDEFQKLSKSGQWTEESRDRSEAEMASALDELAICLAKEVAEFELHHSTVTDTYSRLLAAWVNADVMEQPQAAEAVENLREYRTSVRFCREVTNESQRLLADMGSKSSSLKRSKRRIIAVKADFILHLEAADSQMGAIESMLQKLLAARSQLRRA